MAPRVYDDRPVCICHTPSDSKLFKDTSKDFSWIKEDLVALCCQLNAQNTSKTFQEIWAKLESFHRATFFESRPLMGLEIPVHVIVGKPEYSNASGTASRRVWHVVKNAIHSDQVRWGWFSSFSCGHPSLARRPHSSFYVSYVVDAMKPTKDRTLTGTSTGFMKLVTEMSREARFTDLRLCLVPRRSSLVDCRTISTLLCNDAAPNGLATKQRGVGCLCVDFSDEGGLAFNALCSALAVTRSCRAFTATFSRYGSTPSGKSWVWLAYAFFSNRARSNSSVREVSLYDVCLNDAILDSMAKVLKSSSTELELLAISNNLEGSTGLKQDERKYQLREDTPVQVIEEATGRVVSWNSADILPRNGVNGVVLVHPAGDNSSEWADAMVPGIGLCKVQRSSLVLCSGVESLEVQADLELEIEFLEFWRSRHLTRFFELVELHLRSLWLWLPRSSVAVVNVRGILDACRNLEEFALRNRVIDAEQFVQACEAFNLRLYRVECHFDDIRVVTAALEDDSDTLARSLRWWHCDLRLQPRGVSYDEGLRILARMLSENKVLQYLTLAVDASKLDEFQAGMTEFHLQVLSSRERVQMPCKLAFVSVFPSSEHGPALKRLTSDRLSRLQRLAPDTHVVAKIFTFAVDCAVRKVNVIPYEV